jgi:hypothetical protein
MSRLTVPALALTCAALVATASCSTPTSPGGQPASSGSAGASATVASSHFQRLGYRLAVPRGWSPLEGQLEWAQTGGPPRIGAPAFDDFLSPTADPRILVGERPVPDAAPLDQWIDQMRIIGAISYPSGDCNPAEDQHPATLGGEPAQMLAFHCPTDGPKAAIVQVLARHADTGWVVNCFSGSGVPGGLPGLEKQCGRWLSSFRFGA